MREAVICEPVRTPIGRYGGMFASLTAVLFFGEKAVAARIIGMLLSLAAILLIILSDLHVNAS